MMLIKIFSKEECPNCPPAKELGKKLESEGKKVEIFSLDEADGLSEAMFNDVMSTPSVIVIDDDKKEKMRWSGKAPKLEEIQRFL